ncbi:hypothetical protein HDV03_001342 [Kappamyces sp. JEL0829]|nr:hypothetical protein HDV03_001342 [Kappamyces sp. JEL0829]
MFEDSSEVDSESTMEMDSGHKQGGLGLGGHQKPSLPKTSQKTWMAVELARIVVLSLTLPILVYSIAKSYVPMVDALLLSGIPPLCDTFANIVCNGTVDIVSFLAILAAGGAALIAYLTQDPKLLLAKDSLFTMIFASVFLYSLCLKENLVWRYNKQLHSRDPAAMARLDKLFETDAIAKTSTDFMTKVWGVALMLEAILRIVLIYSLDPDVMVYVSYILVIVTMGGLLVWSWLYVRHIHHRYPTSQLVSIL